MENVMQYLPYSTLLLFAGLAVLIGYGFVNWLEAHNSKPPEKRFSTEENWPRWFYNLAIIAVILYVANAVILVGYWLTQIISVNTLTFLRSEVDWERLTFYYLIGGLCLIVGWLIYVSDRSTVGPNLKSDILNKMIRLAVILWLSDLVLWVIIMIFSWLIPFMNNWITQARG